MKKSNVSLLLFLYRYHRRLGLIACLPMVVLAFTGILLNHSQLLSLDSIYITRPAILKWYGLAPKSEPIAIHVGEYWIATFENLLYVNGKLVDRGAAAPIGAGMLNNELVITTEDSILLLDPTKYSVIEKLGRETLPQGTLRAMAIREGRLLLDTTTAQYSAPSDISRFALDSRPPLPLAERSGVPKDLYQTMLESWRGQGLSLWRLVLDLHNGSFFGKFGSLIADLSALCIFGLVISGLYLWRRTPAR